MVELRLYSTLYVLRQLRTTHLVRMAIVDLHNVCQLSPVRHGGSTPILKIRTMDIISVLTNFLIPDKFIPWLSNSAFAFHHDKERERRQKFTNRQVCFNVKRWQRSRTYGSTTEGYLWCGFWNKQIDSIAIGLCTIHLRCGLWYREGCKKALWK